MMIVLFTDFGVTGPYVGQMKAVLARQAPGVPVIDLMSDAPGFDPRLSAYVLAALVTEFPPPCVFLTVVDPGVGSARKPVIVNADGRLFVGPDNGLLSLVARRAGAVVAAEIIWRPDRLSASFHGRDLFAPVAAELARDGWAAVTPPRYASVDPASISRPGWPDDWPGIVYVDAYGNVWTGVRAAVVPAGTTLTIAGRKLPRVRTFADVPAGCPMVYENSSGLLEVAVNGGSAAELLHLRPGDFVEVADGR